MSECVRRTFWRGEVNIHFPDSGVVQPADDLFVAMTRVVGMPCEPCPGTRGDAAEDWSSPEAGRLTLDMVSSNAPTSPGAIATPFLFAVLVGVPNSAREEYRGRWSPVLSRVKTGCLVELGLPAAGYIEVRTMLRPDQLAQGQSIPYRVCLEATWERCCTGNRRFDSRGRDVTTIFSAAAP